MVCQGTLGIYSLKRHPLINLRQSSPSRVYNGDSYTRTLAYSSAALKPLVKFSVLMNVLIDDKVLLTPLVKFDVLMNACIDNKVLIRMSSLLTYPALRYIVTQYLYSCIRRQSRC